MDNPFSSLASLDAQGVAAFVASAVVALHAARVVCDALRPVVRLTETDADDKALEGTARLVGWLVGFVDLLRGEKPATKKVVKNG